MSAEPQRDIEHDLRAYKQRRDGQLGAPFELHPATRRMLHGEVARTAGRPLLTSEEAAKEFARSFVLSHPQQPDFFTRYKPRLLWGGGMFACLAVVVLVLRNDPQQSAREHLFTDARPAPAAANPRGLAVASGPTSDVRPEREDRRSSAANAPLSAATPVTGNVSAGRLAAQAEAPVNRVLPRSADRKLLESVDKAEVGAGAQPAKALKAPEADTLKKDAADKGGEVVELQFKSSEKLRRAQSLTRSASGGSPGAGGLAAGTPAPMPAAAPVVAASSAAAPAFGAAAGQAGQRFQQLEQQSNYRRNFNSPPVPEVMKDFAFERNGDHVRIVDADGSTYSGTVLPVSAEESREKQTAAKERETAFDAKAQQPQAAAGYRFRVSGVNRKLNQSVEFRGEWRPAAATAGLPALRQTSRGGRLETRGTDQQRTPATNAPANQAAIDRFFYSVPTQQDASRERISGRAIIGGNNEFDINAVPK